MPFFSAFSARIEMMTFDCACERMLQRILDGEEELKQFSFEGWGFPMILEELCGKSRRCMDSQQIYSDARDWERIDLERIDKSSRKSTHQQIISNRKHRKHQQPPSSHASRNSEYNIKPGEIWRGEG